MQHDTHTQPDRFPVETTGLPEARPPELVELSDGDSFELRIAPVAKRVGDATVRMLAYNGSIPGPILKVQEGSEIVVDVENQGDVDATVHWHGLRLENRYDGTHETQRPIRVGERFSAKTLAFIAEMDMDAPTGDGPNHLHHEHGGHEHHGHGAAGGIEWEDDMVAVNRLTTPASMRWKVIDRETGAENAAIDWQFRIGDQVKIRLVNEMAGDHPVHHPFHVHGAGRFLVLARDGVVETNLVWKDTVRETVDILLDVTNPGLWMAHCHIAEHHESGMMFSFNVAPSESDR